ncbi:MAG: hypothetical protein NC211_05400 [Alistipes senegalensis]|nr:hypothetical protein [Oxalobacter formigenes]MCM1281253.1 hypothetical protein [Alistipes senegalensis]
MIFRGDDGRYAGGRGVLDHPFFSPALVIVLLVLPLANWFLLDRDTAIRVTVIVDEYITIALYFVAMAVLLFYRPKDNNRVQNFNFWIFELVTLSALLREWGIQHWLTRTDTTALKIRFFLNPANPVSEKIVAGLFLLLWVVVAVHLVRRYALFMIREFFQGNAVVWTIATTCAVTVFTKFIDRYPDNYRRFTGESLSLFWDTGCSSFEEIPEAYLPILIMIAAIQFSRSRIRRY